MTVLYEPDRSLAGQLAFAIGGEVTTVDSPHALTRTLTDRPDELLVVVGPGVPADIALEFAEEERGLRPALGVVISRHKVEAAVLVGALRAGVREVVPVDDLPALAAACGRSLEISHRLQANLGASASRPHRRGQVVTVFSGKGGAGKTTVATNLAAALSATKRVCLVDLDLEFGDVAIALQLSPAHTMSDASAMHGHLDEAGIRSLLLHHESGIDALLAPERPSEKDQITPGLVDDLLRTLTAMYEVVVVDTPPSFTDHVLRAIDRTDLVLLVATPDLPSLKNLRLTIDTLRQLGLPDEHRVVVLNRADAKVGITAADVERIAGTKIGLHVPSSNAVPASVNRGELLARTSPKHPVSKAIRHFAEQRFPASTADRPTTRLPRPRFARAQEVTA